MKRCSQCNRLESDDTLGFCRVDGTPLITDSSSADLDAGTMMLGSGPVAAEAETNRLTDASTNISNVRATGPTTILPAHAEAERTQTLSRWVLIGSVFALILIGAAAYAYYVIHNRNAVISSIAVMPFLNEGGNADVEYLSDGMTETLISSLSQLQNLNVRPRSSVFRYKGKETNPQTIGSELNVQAILNGRVTQRGQDLSLFVELIDVALDKVVWSQQYNRKQTDLLTLQSDIARDVSSRLTSKLSGADEAKVTKTYTTNPDAYQLYLKGKYYQSKYNEESYQKAIDYYKQAIDLDPNYALAYLGIGFVLPVLHLLTGLEPESPAGSATLQNPLLAFHSRLAREPNHFVVSTGNADDSLARAFQEIDVAANVSMSDAQ